MRSLKKSHTRPFKAGCGRLWAVALQPMADVLQELGDRVIENRTVWRLLRGAQAGVPVPQRFTSAGEGACGPRFKCWGWDRGLGLGLGLGDPRVTPGSPLGRAWVTPG